MFFYNKYMSLPIKQKFSSELMNLIDKTVEVTTTMGRKYVGKVSMVEPENFSTILVDAKDDQGNFFALIVLNGIIVSEIKLLQFYNMKELAERLEKVFPRLVFYDEISKVIVVANSVRVLPNGTVEGSGPLADKVKAICNEFFKKYP